MARSRNPGIGLVLVMVLIAGLQIRSWSVRAPELFGEARMTMVQAGPVVAGVIHSDWTTYAIAGRSSGTRVECRMTWLAGARISGSERGVPCGMEFSNLERFRGWIDFRGHPRPFCGSVRPDNFNARCMAPIRLED